MRKIYLYGAGDHERVIINALQENGLKSGVDFINIGKCTYLKDIPVTHNPVKFPLIISFGDNATRKKIATELNSHDFGKAISKHAIAAPSALVDYGTMIMAGAISRI